MLLRKALLALGMVGLIGGVGISAAQTGPDVVIVNTWEDVETGCPEVCSLREAVAIVAEGGMVTFEDSLWTVVLMEPLLIDRDLTIDGNAVTRLEGGIRTKLLIIRDADVLLRRLSISGGFAEDAGGAIENHGRLTLEATHLYGNVSTEGGGAIFTTGTLIVSDSQFVANDAPFGGAITIADTNDARIIGSTFSVNNAEVNGGAIYGDFGGFVVINSTFEGNEAGNGGGAILMDGFLDRGVVLNSTIVRNRAAFGGGVCNLDEDSLFMLVSNIVAENDAERSPDVCPLMTSGGHNLIGVSAGGRWIASDLLDRAAGVGIMQENGGTTPTISINFDSAAIGMGDCGGYAALFIDPVTTDQRGVARKIPCDVGSYERESPTN